MLPSRAIAITIWPGANTLLSHSHRRPPTKGVQVLQKYLSFLLSERRVLTFGISMTFFSSFGQTFLFAIFVPYFLSEFALSNTEFGSLYSLATLTSAFLLPILGQWIDRIPIKYYSLSVAGLMSLASLLMAASWSIASFFIAVLLLRLAGQGLSGHTADTTMAKAFDHQRGKALSISSLGYAAGEGVLPLAIAGLASFMYWRNIWWLTAFLLLLFVMPAIYRLISKHPLNEHVRSSNRPPERATFRLFENAAMLRDPRTPYILPAALMPPFWMTGFLLYQISFGRELGWTPTLIASAFILFAITRVFASLAIGPIIDRFSARRVFPFFLVPLTTALIIPLVLPPKVSIYLYMIMFGVSLGIGNSLKSALLAELYGTEYLGAIRSLFASLMIFGTGLSPFLMGYLLDSRVPLAYIFTIAILTCAFSMLLAFRLYRPDMDRRPAGSSESR